MVDLSIRNSGGQTPEVTQGDRGGGMLKKLSITASSHYFDTFYGSFVKKGGAVGASIKDEEVDER